MKSSGRKQSAEQTDILHEQKEEKQNPAKEIIQESNTPDLRTRISNAVKAIKSLGGEAEEIDRSSSTDEELKIELEDLTNQYKRLKNSKAVKK